MTIQDDAGFAHIIAARGCVGSFFILILQIKPNAPPFRIQQRATRVAGLEADKKDVLHPALLCRPCTASETVGRIVWSRLRSLRSCRSISMRTCPG